MSKENKTTVDVYEKTAYMYLKNSKMHDDMDKEKAEKKALKLHNFIKEVYHQFQMVLKFLK